jgi:hypothetical protein
MKLSLAVLAVAAMSLLSVGGASVAQAEETSQGQAATSETPNEDDVVICRRIKEMGSNLGKRKVCMTRAEWAKLADDSKRFHREADEPREFAPDGGTLIGPVGN